MKKNLLILTIISVAGIMSSCKKTYQCECSWNSGSLSGQVQTIESQTKLTKKQAETWCEGQTYSGASFECKLK